MKGPQLVPESARGVLLASRGSGRERQEMYRITPGLDGGTVVLVNAEGEQSHVLKLGSVMAHSPYGWTFHVNPDLDCLPEIPASPPWYSVDVSPSGPEREAVLKRLKAQSTEELRQERGEEWVRRHQGWLDREWEYIVDTFM